MHRWSFAILFALFLLGCTQPTQPTSAAPTTLASVPPAKTPAATLFPQSVQPHPVYELSLAANETKIPVGVVDPKGEFAYFIAWDNTAFENVHNVLVKIRLNDFSIAGRLELFPEAKELIEPVFAVIDPSSRFIYVGFGNGQILKVSLTDFTRGPLLTLDKDGVFLNPNAGVMDARGEYLYLVAQPRQGVTPHVFKIRLSNFSVAGRANMNKVKGRASGATIDPKGEYVYFGVSDTPNTQVVKLRTSDMSQAGALTIVEGKGNVGDTISVVTDNKGQYAYFTVTGSSRLIEVRLTDFQVSGEWTPSRGTTPYSIVVDPQDRFLYIGGASGTVIKIDLSDFSESELIETGFLRNPNFQGDASSTLLAAVMDPNGQFAYFSTSFHGSYLGKAGNIVKVGIS